jgi:hypothetical protein
MQSWPPRVTHGGYVAVGGGVASLVGSLGGVVSVTRNDVGDYTIALRAPGVPGYAAHNTSAIPQVTPVNNAFANVVCTLASATELTVFAFDAAGVAADSSFAFSIVTTERAGGAPA